MVLYVFANLRAWGWITLIIGALQLVAVGGIVTGNLLARSFAVAMVELYAIDMMFFIPAYPFWATHLHCRRRWSSLHGLSGHEGSPHTPACDLNGLRHQAAGREGAGRSDADPSGRAGACRRQTGRQFPLAFRSWQPRSPRRACRAGRCRGRGSPS